MGFLLNTMRRTLNLAGRGARGAVGIAFLGGIVPAPGQYIVKAAGDRMFTGATGATPANAVALTDLAASTGSGLVGWLRGVSGAVLRSVLAKVGEMAFSPEDFGAVGDGVTDDTTAFVNLGSAISAIGSGTISLRPGAVYRVGDETFAGGTGKGYAYRTVGGLNLTGCGSVTIRGNGATMKWLDGLHYGGFDPSTANTPVAGGTSNDKAASLGSLLRITSSGNIVVENLTLDGNLANLVIGGTWNPPGIQLEADGVHITQCSTVALTNVRSLRNGRDGFYLTGNGTAQFASRDDVSTLNCKADGNGRQGASLTGGSGYTFISTSFSNTGQTINTGTGTNFQSSPAGGVDIEANGAGWNTHIAFLNCAFVNNLGVGLLSSQGNCDDLLVKQCTFWQGFGAIAGVTAGSGDAYWITKPLTKAVIEDCTVHGCLTNVGSIVQQVRCIYNDDVHPTFGRAGQNRAYLLDNAGGMFSECVATVNGTAGNRLYYDGGATLRRCTFNYYGTGLATGTYVSFGLSVAQDLTLNDNLAAGSNYYYIGSAFSFAGAIKNTGTGVAWKSVGGALGDYPSAAALTTSLRVATNTLLPVGIDWGTAPPTSGAWGEGSVRFNYNAAASGTVGWVCTATGTPGTWKTFGAISA